MANHPGFCLKTAMDSKGTRITLKPVMKPLLEAEVKTNPQAWVKKAPKRKRPTKAPGQRRLPDQDRRLAKANGSNIKQAKEKRINRKLAGVVTARASFTMAKEVPQKMDTPSKTPSAAREEEKDEASLGINLAPAKNLYLLAPWGGV